MSKQQFFIGIGAQKGGTTWLSRYLDNHPSVCFSPIKELHYFDCVYRSDLNSRYNNKFIRNLKSISESITNPVSQKKTRRCQLNLFRLRMIHEKQAYRDYFDFIKSPDEFCFGEITPAYSILKKDGFQAIRDMYPDAKVIFILRNPADRYWSHLRHKEKRQKKNKKKMFSAIDQFKNRLDDPNFVLRTRYERTLALMDEIFPPENILILFYEQIFGDNGREEIKRLTEFLGIKFIEPDFNVKVNVNTKATIKLSDELRLLAVKNFASTYKYVNKRFPERIPQNWLEDLKTKE